MAFKNLDHISAIWIVCIINLHLILLPGEGFNPFCSLSVWFRKMNDYTTFLETSSPLIINNYGFSNIQGNLQRQCVMQYNNSDILPNIERFTNKLLIVIYSRAESQLNISTVSLIERHSQFHTIARPRSRKISRIDFKSLQSVENGKLQLIVRCH